MPKIIKRTKQIFTYPVVVTHKNYVNKNQIPCTEHKIQVVGSDFSYTGHPSENIRLCVYKFKNMIIKQLQKEMLPNDLSSAPILPAQRYFTEMEIANIEKFSGGKFKFITIVIPDEFEIECLQKLPDTKLIIK